jgi:hypothetical protein
MRRERDPSRADTYNNFLFNLSSEREVPFAGPGDVDFDVFTDATAFWASQERDSGSTTT